MRWKTPKGREAYLKVPQSPSTEKGDVEMVDHLAESKDWEGMKQFFRDLAKTRPTSIAFLSADQSLRPPEFKKMFPTVSESPVAAERPVTSAPSGAASMIEPRNEQPLLNRNLSGWAIQAKAHWKKYRPKIYRELQQSGRLNQAAQQAADNTGEALADCIESGMSYDQAWEYVREQYLFFPSEEDMPHLGESSDR